MKKHLPNLITLLNLFSGCIAALMAFNDQLLAAGLFVGLGIFFDFFDGLIARALKVSGELGTQMDSLADMVTSGLVPGIVMYQMLNDALGVQLFDDAYHFTLATKDYWLSHPYIPFIGFLITLGSCYRLAKFNIDTRQTDSFIGLPTPANALLIISLGIIAQDTNIDWVYQSLNNPYILMLITIFSAYILNAELPLFALKFKNWGLAGNKLRYLFVVLCIVLIATLQLYAVPCIILLYIVMSLVYQQLYKNKAAVEP